MVEIDETSSESEVIKGLKAGNEEAYQYLYKKQYKILCIIACEYVKDDFVAEMIVSDVIFAIWQNRESLNIHTSLRNYLLKSVRNRCLNYLAQSKRQFLIRETIGIEYADSENYANNPLGQLIEKELDVTINNSIEALPEQTRMIFCLSRFNNLKYEEIACNMNISVDVVKYHIKTALARLRSDLKDYLIILLVMLLP